MRRRRDLIKNDRVFATETYLVELRWESSKKFQLALSCCNGGKPTTFRLEGAIATGFHLLFTTNPLHFLLLYADYGFQSICISLPDSPLPLDP